MKKQAVKGEEPGTDGHFFQLTGGHPALDLVNTLDWRFRESGPEELLRDYSDVVRFTQQSGLMSAGDARRLMRTVPTAKAIKAIAAVRELRESAAEVLYAAVEQRTPSTSVVKRLEESFAVARQEEKLHWDGEQLEWSLPSSHPASPFWLLSLSTAEFMTSDRIRLLRECGNVECRWLFVDTSKNHTRRWCDMKICGNRMKARRFRAEHGR